MDQNDVLPLLSAMFAPVILINACGLFVLSTSQRLSRQLDRVRVLAGVAEGLASGGERVQARRKYLADLLHRTVRRAHLLQRALAAQYVSIGVFVLAVIALGAVRLRVPHAGWIPVGLILGGVSTLLYSCILLLVESRAAYETVRKETAHALDLVR